MNDEKPTAEGCQVKHTEILDALKKRSTWEKRQETWYDMRHDGIRRKVKPWPNAADMHFPLADMQVEKFKPVYVAQVYATDTLASFCALDAGQTQFQAGAGQWFDYKLKQETNFEEEIIAAIDTMLVHAKCIVKAYWDSERNEVRFDAINPLYIIVPTGTNKLAEADWIVHVQHFSKAQYARREDFKQDEAFVKTLCGKGEASLQNEEQKLQREGLTCGTSDDEIVVWELFYRKEKKWWVKTYCPNRPSDPIRAEFGLPYHKGIFEKGVPPFAEFNAELKDKGYFAPRGIPERVAPFEASLNKDWNTQKDYQSQTCQPVFSAKGGLPTGSQNVRMVPGTILPFEIQAVQFPSMPMDIGMQMQGTRAVAEQAIGAPDFGASQNAAGQKPRTAKEIGLVEGMANQGMDLRSRIFRRELGYLFKLSWALYLQYASDGLRFFFDGQIGELPAGALTDKYLIEPSGSADNVNRQFVMQKAVARWQMFNGNPNIEQRELIKTVLEADDARMVKRLLLNAGTQAAMQLEDQAQEITIMMIGFPAEVRETDDDAAHVQSLVGFVQRRNQLREPLNAEQMRQIAQHGKLHMQAMKKKNPQGYQQHMQQSAPLFAELEQLAGQVQQAEQARQQMQAGGVAPGGQPMPPQGAPMGGPQPMEAAA